MKKLKLYIQNVEDVNSNVERVFLDVDFPENKLYIHI